MKFIRPQSDFPTLLFKFTMVALVGFGLGAATIWLGLSPSVGKLDLIANQFPKTAKPITTQAPTRESPPLALTPLADWKAESNVSGGFSLKRPPLWKTLICPDNPATLYIAPTAAALAVCNSGNIGQMSVYSMTGDQRINFDERLNFPGKIETTVTVSGVSGTRTAATAKEPEGIGPPAGSKLVQYLFFTGGRTYTCFYQQSPTGNWSTDVLAEFDTICKSTLKFQA